MRFNPPPGWPVPPPGWVPEATWTPDPSWPPAPPGWQFVVNESRPGIPRRIWWLVAAVVAVVAMVFAGGGFLYHHVNQPDVVVLKPVDSQGKIQPGWVEDRSRADDRIDCSFGSPSPYDRSSQVRDCGATADSADACWPAADGQHVLCLTDPFSNVLNLIGAQGLTKPRKSLSNGPTPFALLLDDGTQCRARHGGSWGAPKERPDWVGHFSCRVPGDLDNKAFVAVWGPPDKGIDQGFGGWTVMVGPEDGHLTKHKVSKAYYVGVAAPGEAANDNSNSRPGGTQLVTKCGHPPEFKPETIRADSGALVIRMRIVAHCPGGDLLSSSNTRITVTSGGQNIASGTFDLSSDPIVIAPGSGGGSSDPAIEHDFRFPVGTFWRLPVSTQQAPSTGSTQQGAVDIDVKTLVVECEQSGSSRQSADGSSGSQSSTAVGPAQPKTGDNESASFDAVRAIANADRPFVIGRLTDTWVPQLSSKRPGLVADGITWNNAEILREHLELRLKYPEVRLLWSGDWSTFSAPDYWITIAGVTFPDSGGALAWCRARGFDRDHCYAKLVSTTHPIDGSTAFNP